MIISINDWKKAINEHYDSNNPSGCLPFGNIDPERLEQARKIAEYAKDFDMSKPDTIGMVSKIFVDPSQAPDDISVSFVQDNLTLIIDILDKIPDSEYPENPMTFDTTIQNNEFPFECVMYIKNNSKIQKLTEALNNNIKKNGFIASYNNNIFYINSLDKLNEKNTEIVMKVLNEANAKNVTTQLKWKRKIK